MTQSGGTGPPSSAERLLATLARLLALATPTLRETVQAASDLLAEALRADKIDVFLYEEASESLVALGTSQTAMGRRQHALGLDRLPVALGSLAVWTFLTHAPSHTGHADAEPRELARVVQELGVHAEIATPLVVGGQSRGVLLACSAVPEHFDLADLQFLTAVAYWLGLVAHYAELRERVTRRTVGTGTRLTPEQALALVEHELAEALGTLDAGAEDPAESWKGGLVRWKLRQLETLQQETEGALAVVQATLVQSQAQLVTLQAAVERLTDQRQQAEEAEGQAGALREAARIRRDLEEKLQQAQATIARLEAQLSA